MVAFSEYVSIAYDVAKAQPWYDREMTGPGSQQANQRFMAQLAKAYEAEGHESASRSAAREFLQDAVGPP